MKRNVKVAAPKKLGPHPGYFDPEQIRQREEIAEISRRDAQWKCEGFAEMVINKWFGAMGPPDRTGRPRTWQGIGRDLFGEEMFNQHMKAAVERRRAARQESQPAR